MELWASLGNYEGRISKWVNEPDNGMYDALNEGIRMATGDVIGFLHADDMYAGRESQRS